MLLPRLRVTEANGDSWDDPSDEQLAALVGELTVEHRFLVVERHDRPGLWQHFFQAYLNDDLTYRVEHREGGPEAHFEARAPEAKVVAEILVAWAADEDGWREAVSWQPWRDEAQG